MLIRESGLGTPGECRPGRVAGTRELVVHLNYILIYNAAVDLVRVLRVQQDIMARIFKAIRTDIGNSPSGVSERDLLKLIWKQDVIEL